MKNRSQNIRNRSPRWKRTVVSSAVAIAVSSLCAPTILAATCDVNITTGQIAPCTLTGIATTTIGVSGVIAVDGSSGVGATITVDDLATAVEITNHGVLSNTTQNSAILVAASAVGTTITNHSGATISATSAAAINFSGNLDGSLDNAGTISSVANVTSGGSATATGIFVGGGLLGTLINIGTIVADSDIVRSVSDPVSVAGDAIASAAAVVYAYAVGIGAGVLDIGASIVNSGTIEANSVANAIASATATSTGGAATARIYGSSPAKAYATATGIYAGDMGADSSIVNEGTITAYAAATALATASGVSDAASSVAAASANAYAYATGIEAGNLGDNASITNEGTITASAVAMATSLASASGVAAAEATATATAIANAFATGIEAGDLGSNSSIVNDGTITVSAVAMTSTLATASGVPAAISSDESASAYAAGIVTGNLGTDASISNSGTITVTATADSAEAYGIYTGDLDAGTSITNGNNDSITVTANGAILAKANGILVGNVAAGASISNSGTITATATNTGTGNVIARGIQVGTLSGMDATVTNNDEINAAVTASAAGDGHAAGIYAASVGAGASLVNDGTITATADATATSTVDATVTARGIEVGTLSAADATVTNSSIIDATATASAAGDVNAAGMYVNSLGSAASITNSSFGTITVTAIGEATSTVDSTATAHGIGAGTLSGMVMNDAEIMVVASAAGAGEVYAAGIHANSLSSGASISGSGTITADATSTGAGTAYARGIEAGTLSGTITNDLTIAATATAEAAGDAHAAAVHADSLGSVATINGSGTITADATTTGAGGAYARGIELGTLSGTLTNNLAIEVTAEAAGNVYATSIYADSSANASINGSSSIAADAMATGTGIATARGIEIVTPSGILTNYLTIVSTATGTSGNADSYGVDAGSMSGGAAIINSSAITVDASVTDGAGSSAASAYGMFADGLSGADTNMTNTSEIDAKATGTLAGDSAKAYGMRATSLDADAVLANEGTINVEAGGGAGVASAFGIYVDTLDSTVRNSGTIIATAPVAGNDAYSVFAGSGTGEVSNSGYLYGRVDLGGTVNMTNTGLLSIANNGNVAGSTIGGDYTQSSTGVLRFGVTDTTDYTRLTVVGDAIFVDGIANLSVDVPENNTLDSGAPEQLLPDVVSATAVLGIDRINVTDNSLAWQFVGDVNGTTIDLEAFTTGMTTLAAVAGSSGTAGVAGAIDDILASNGKGDGMEALYTLTSLGTEAEVAAALQSFTPALGGNAAPSMVEVLRSGATRVVHEHLQDGSGVASGDGILSEDAVWLKPFGSWAKQKDRSGTFGYKADSFGLVAGMDGRISDQWVVGGALSYSKGNVETNNGAHEVGIKTFQASAYATNHFNETNALNLQFDLGSNRNDSRREVAGSVASADYRSRHIMMSAELERAFRMSNKTTLTPAVGVEYVNVKVGGYAESGSPLSLTVDSHSQKAVILSLGGTAAYKLDDEATLTARLNLGHDIKAEQAQVTASFSNFGGSTFVTNGINPSANVIRAGVGYEIEKASGTSIVTRYDLDTKSSGYTNHMLSLNLKTLF